VGDVLLHCVQTYAHSHALLPTLAPLSLTISMYETLCVHAITTPSCSAAVGVCMLHIITNCHAAAVGMCACYISPQKVTLLQWVRMHAMHHHKLSPDAHICLHGMAPQRRHLHTVPCCYYIREQDLHKADAAAAAAAVAVDLCCKSAAVGSCREQLLLAD
jgi:hypothetical protein